VKRGKAERQRKIRRQRERENPEIREWWTMTNAPEVKQIPK